MKRTLLVFIVLIVCHLSPAQSLQWGAMIGSMEDDSTSSVAVDKSGNIYIAGLFRNSTDFDPSATSFLDKTAVGGSDAYIAKYTPAGALAWVRTIGSPKNDRARGIFIDKNNDIFVCGWVGDTADIDPGSGVNKADTAGQFIVKLSSSGNTLMSIRSGGEADCISIDQWGYIYTLGHFSGTVDFDRSSGYLVKKAGGIDFFLAKYTSNGKMIRVGHMPATGDNRVSKMLNGKNGDVYMVGGMGSSIDFDPGPGQVKKGTYLSFDMIFAKYDTSGSLLWAHNIAGASSEYAYGFDFDKDENLYITGHFKDSTDFDPGPGVTYRKSVNKTTDLFIAKYDKDGYFKSVVTMGYTDEDYVHDIDIDTFGNIYICGTVYGPLQFISMGDTARMTAKVGSGDVFIVKFGPDMKFKFFSVIGAPYSDYSAKIVVDYQQSFVIAGRAKQYMDFETDRNKYPYIKYGVKEYDLIFAKYTCYSTKDTIISFCDSFRSFSKKFLWVQAGIYRDTLRNFKGCDSIIRVDLRSLTTKAKVNMKGCGFVRSSSKKFIWTQSGLYYDTTVNGYGCKAYIEANVVINGPSYDTINVKTCNQYISPSKKYIFVKSGLYQDTLKNFLGCDSVITIDLILGYSTYSNLQFRACDGMHSPSGKYYWDVTSIFKDTLLNYMGCDSFLLVDLTVFRSNSSYKKINVCENYFTAPSGKYVWTSSGDYWDTIPTTNACDSVIHFQLKFLQSSSSMHEYDVCNGAWLKVGSRIYSKSGIYHDTLVNQAGCDSVMEIRINVKPAIDMAIEKQGRVLKAVQGYDAYQWLGCHNVQYSLINGETGDSLYAQEPGIYSVQITEDGCRDTAVCVEIFPTELRETSYKKLKVYPNPFDRTLILESETEGYVRLMDINGRVVFEQEVSALSNTLNLPALQEGVYLLEFRDADTLRVLRLVNMK